MSSKTSLELKSAKLDKFPELIKALGGKHAALRLPVLDLGQRMGHTGYLDFLTPKDLSAPIMRGIDSLGRPFIAICYRTRERVSVECLFQRYTDDPKTWTAGHHRDYSGHEIDMRASRIRSGTPLCAFQMDRLRRLVRSEPVAHHQMLGISLSFSDLSHDHAKKLHEGTRQLKALASGDSRCYEPRHTIGGYYVRLCDPNSVSESNLGQEE